MAWPSGRARSRVEVRVVGEAPAASVTWAGADRENGALAEVAGGWETAHIVDWIGGSG